MIFAISLLTLVFQALSLRQGEGKSTTSQNANKERRYTLSCYFKNAGWFFFLISGKKERLVVVGLVVVCFFF